MFAPLPAAVETIDLSFSYRDQLILDRINIRVQNGEHLFIHGPSGTGKSSLLRLIAGLERATGGEIRLYNDVVSAPGKHTPPEARTVGLVPQDVALSPQLTVRENIELGLANFEKSKRLCLCQNLLRSLEIEHLAHHYPAEISSEHQQRVAFARALAPEPKVLLLDEAFSSLAPAVRDAAREAAFRTTKARGTTVIHVSQVDAKAEKFGGKSHTLSGDKINEPLNKIS